MEIIRVNKDIHQRNMTELLSLRERVSELETYINGVTNEERNNLHTEIEQRDLALERAAKREKHLQGQLNQLSHTMIRGWIHDGVKSLEILRDDLDSENVSYEDAAIRVQLVIGYLTRNENRSE